MFLIDENNNYIKDKAKKVLRKRAGKAVAKTVQKALSVFLKALLKLLLLAIKFLPFILVALVFLSLSYYITNELRGVGKVYDYLDDNEIVELTPNEVEKDGTLMAKKLNIRNQLVLDFYKYHSLKSAWQIDVEKGDSKDALKRENLISSRDVDKFKKDYYGREQDFLLTPDLLFSLDNVIFEEDLRYPEQFVKPVAYDEETFKIKDIVDDNGNVLVDSKKRDLDTGKEIGTEKGLSDYGFGTIMKMREMKERTLLKGVYFKEDYYDETTGMVMQKEISEPFEIELAKPKEKNYIIDKAVSVAGNIEYRYEDGYELQELSKADEESANERDNVGKILYKVVQQVTPEGQIVDIPLYKYRNEDSGIYKEVEVPAEPDKEDKGIEYYNDYLTHFKIYLPKDVLLDIRYRIDYTDLEKMKEAYGSVNEENKTINPGSVNIQMGSASESTNVTNTMKYFNTIQAYADTFGVDPYVIMAMIAQESGGDPNARGGGLLQIVPGTKVTANGKNGKETLTVHNPYNIDDSIKFAAMRLKANLDKYNGNYFLAIMAHNMGEGTVGIITEMFKDKLADNSWVNPYDIEKARRAAIDRYAPRYRDSASAGQGCFMNGYDRAGVKKYWGDTCYLWNVLRYYAGNNPNIKEVEGTGSLAGAVGNPNGPSPEVPYTPPSGPADSGSSSGVSGGTTEKTGLLNSAYNSFVKLVSKTVNSLNLIFKDAITQIVKLYNEPYPVMVFEKRMGPVEAREIRILAKSYQNQMLFSRAFEEDPDKPSLFDDGFMENYNGGPMGSGWNGGVGGGAGVYYGEGGFVPPLETNIVVSPFGTRVHPVLKTVKFHAGVDLRGATGTPVMASSDGVVSFAGEAGSYGNVIFIDHAGNIQTRYAHLSKIAVSKGQNVKTGQIIGYVGATGRVTGPHLHFEYRVGGKPIDPTPITQGKLREKRDPNALSGSMGLKPADSKVAQIAIDFALEQAKNKVPYGRDRGFDCSSLILAAYTKAGLKNIPPTTSAWVSSGKMRRVNSIADLKPGDAIICSNSKNPTGHIIMYLGDNKYVHASSTYNRVYVDSFLTNSYHRNRLRLDLVFRP